MADISYLNIGGSDYTLKDTTARTDSTNLQTMLAYKEDGNTASQAYSVVGTPINWKGTLYYLKTAVAAGTTWTVGTNLTAATNLGKLTSNIKTYVNSSGKLVFRDLTGADTVLNFSGTEVANGYFTPQTGESKKQSINIGFKPDVVILSYSNTSNSYRALGVWCKAISTTQFYYACSTDGRLEWYTLSSTHNYSYGNRGGTQLSSIDNNGFTVFGANDNGNYPRQNNSVKYICLRYE